MNYKIVEKPEFKVAGKSIRVPTKDGQNMVLIPEFWQTCMQDGTVPKLAGLASNGAVVKDALLGICMDFSANMDEFTYMVAVDTSTTPDGMVERTIPSATWAVFEAKGPMPDAIQNVWAAIWSQFFAVEPYAHAAAPDLEIYPEGDVTDPGYISEVWVPVVSK